MEELLPAMWYLALFIVVFSVPSGFDCKAGIGMASKFRLRMWKCGKLLEEKSLRSLSACGRAQARRPRSFYGDSRNLGRVTVTLS